MVNSGNGVRSAPCEQGHQTTDKAVRTWRHITKCDRGEVCSRSQYEGSSNGDLLILDLYQDLYQDLLCQDLLCHDPIYQHILYQDLLYQDLLYQDHLYQE